MNLSDNLKKIRKENNLSQEQLAEKLGVSRQAVSKWESGISYPEMDKVMQICQLFNININELIHENISEVTEKKKEKENLSKLSNGFFNYITKVVNLFTSMKFKDILKCLFEQLIIILLLFCGFFLIELVLKNVSSYIIYTFPQLYDFFLFLDLFYIIIALVLGVTILLHIFKIRYLDYYEIVEKEDIKNEEKEINKLDEVENKNIIKDNKENKKIILENKREKVIVRDPKHSEYRFIKGLFHLALIFIKILLSLILCFLSIGMIFLVILFIIDFLIIKSGLLFVSIIIGIIGCMLLDYLFILVLFNFIFSKKNNKVTLLIILLSSLLMIGLGTGLGVVSLSQYEIVVSKSTMKTEETIDMKDDLRIMVPRYYNYNYSAYKNGVDYVVDNTINGVKVVIEHSAYDNCYVMMNANNEVSIFTTFDDTKLLDLYRNFIDNLNHEEITQYRDEINVTIYASLENINKLQENERKFYEENNLIEQQSNYIDELLDKNNIKDQIINEIQNVLRDRNIIVTYDEEGNVSINYGE